ncbi:hypothetical protein HNV28_04370 [Myxococcus xanthus]|uniref:Uncharacterized protein n=1 Tax=Myxococcus xanthus TaxID=34 RepID=A0A7Y4IE48_MYXXA|nr:hypothetical protein [Myxococcus xanthus]NOJ87324.1 hypothetical protein [Myxococcus xanthus]
MVLRIRPEQMACLDTSVRGAYVSSVVRFLRTQLPQESADLKEQELRARAERGIDAAARHGITARWDVARFIACQLCLGEHFDTDPAHAWPQAVLARPYLTPSRKMDWIERHYLRPRRGRSPTVP